MVWKPLVVLALPLLFLSDLPRRQVPVDWRAGRDWGNMVIRQEGDVELCYVTTQLGRAPFEVVPVSYFSGNRPDTAPLARLVERFEAETKRPVLAAINGGFFDLKTRLPIGFLLRDGEMDFFNMPQNVKRSMVGFTAGHQKTGVLMATPKEMPKAWLDLVDVRRGGQKRSLAVHHINVPGGRNAFTLYTPRFGHEVPMLEGGLYFVAHQEPGLQGGRWQTLQALTSKTRRGVPIPKNGMVIALHGASKRLSPHFKEGHRICSRWTLPPAWKNARVVHALLAGPRLLEGGRLRVSAGEEKLAHLNSRDRMSLGVTPNGELIFLWAHRKTPGTSLGFEATAQLLAGLGASEAIALDGGSSRAVWSDEFSFNGRPIANALMLTLRNPT